MFGRVKIKHPRPGDLTTKRELLDIIAPTVKVTRLLATRDALIAITRTDKDSDELFRDTVSDKLKAAHFEAIMPPELRCQRAVICFRLDELIIEHTADEIEAEIMRCQDWAEVGEVYKFHRSNTIKITFATSDMAAKASEQGLRIFYFSVPPARMQREVYVPLLTCDRCHAIEQHTTSECPHPATFKLCSECAQQDHTFRDCRSGAKKCLNCGLDHNARAMRCPERKKALKKKEERLRTARTSPTTSFA